MPLPADFVLGATFCAVAAEGAAEASDWRLWERRNLLPHSGEGVGFGTDYRSDLRLLTEQLGIDAVRLELDWARIEPENDKIDSYAVEHTLQVLAAAHDAGLAVWATLVDRTQPGWFALDELGFRDRRSRTYYWPRHVARCAEVFGDLVDTWVPITRPMRWARSAFLTGITPPGRTDVGRFADALVAAHLAQLEAWRVLRGSAPVALSVDVAVVRPTDNEPTTKARARRADALHWFWTAGFRDGELRVADYSAALAKTMPEAFDLIALTQEDRVLVPEHGDWGSHHVAEDLAETLERAAHDGPERPLAVIGQHVANPDELALTLDLVTSLAASGIPLRAWFAAPALDEAPLAESPARPGLADYGRNLTATGTDLAAFTAKRRTADEFAGAVLLGDRPDDENR